MRAGLQGRGLVAIDGAVHARSSVELADTIDIYHGAVRTNERGFATVTLPSSFQALDREFRYQLTAMGRDGWDARTGVWSPILGNQFVIRTSKPGVEVSWQVMAGRRDAHGNANPTPTETAMPAAGHGRYFYPQGFMRAARYAART